MRRTQTLLASAALAVAISLALVTPATPATSATEPETVPPSFFGVVPQALLTPADVEHMSAGGIGSVRWPLLWDMVQPTAEPKYDWSGFDAVVKESARGGIRVLPFLFGTPAWLSPVNTNLPIDTARKRLAWSNFVRAAVERYGPHGQFWRDHWVGSEDPVPKVPVREWQVWNEANFFYFATPASPHRYARLLKQTAPVIKSVEPNATVIVTGLFGDPDPPPPKGMPAVRFLRQLYRVPGIAEHFDGVALHPYADGAARLKEITDEFRQVSLDNGDPEARLYITEMGWGSQNNPEVVSFERGVRGQVKELRLSYSWLIENRRRLNLRGTYWFSWKDLPDACNFCDSVGFFHRGNKLRPKPAWHAFVRLTGGRARP